MFTAFPSIVLYFLFLIKNINLTKFQNPSRNPRKLCVFVVLLTRLRDAKQLIFDLVKHLIFGLVKHLTFDLARRLATHFCASRLAVSDVPTVAGSWSSSVSGVSHHRPRVGRRSSQGLSARPLSPYSKPTWADSPSAAGSGVTAGYRFGFQTGFSIIATAKAKTKKQTRLLLSPPRL